MIDIKHSTPNSEVLAVTHLLYLHGFRSSPASAKARQTLAWLQAHAPSVHWSCPQLPPSPKEALAMIREILSSWDFGTKLLPTRLGLVGSSLGGFYAAQLANAAGCRAALINPAVDPARLLADHIGEQRQFHGEDVFYFRPEFINELRNLDQGPPLNPKRVMVLIAKGDEVLDWRVMAQQYEKCQLSILEGGDHALSDYPQHLPAVMGFMGLGT